MTRQSDTDLQRHLDEQVGFLVTSARAYDSGLVAEAKRLAVVVRTLVHDTGHSSSLLGQLGMKERLFHDSAGRRPSAIASSYAGLVGVRIEPLPPSYVPSFNTWSGRVLAFDDWWTATIIADLQGREVSRQRLILAAANKDGGAHVDRELDDVYAALSRVNSMGMAYRSSTFAEQPVPGVDHASIRQIAHELLGSLGREQPLPSSVGRTVTLHNPTATAYLGVSAPAIGRNEPCWCGSGRKYKKCHAAKIPLQRAGTGATMNRRG